MFLLSGVAGCLAMEECSSKGLHERGEDVPTSVAVETNSSKEPGAPVEGMVAAALPVAHHWRKWFASSTSLK